MAAPSLQTNDREVELIQRVCRGEHEAFYELMRPYERAIYFAAVNVLSNPADAEEVAQEIVLKAVKAVPSFRFEFGNWIIQIAINESRMKLARTGATSTSRSIRSARRKKVIIAPGILLIGERFPRRSSKERNYWKRSDGPWLPWRRSTARY